MTKFISLSICIFFLLSFSSAQNGWTNLFDGKSLNGWKKLAGNADYKIENGAIVGITVPNTPNTFLVTEKEYGDFVLELEVMIEDTTSNSGIQFRSQYDATGNRGQGKVFGYQYELDPSSRKWTGGLYDEGRRDWLYPLMLHPSAQNAYRHRAFNKVRIECIGDNIKTWVNDIPAAYVVDNIDAKGLIALQVHAINNPEMAGKRIHWKNIRIKTTGLTPSSFPKDVYVVNTLPNTLSDFEKSNGWKLLFDGKTNTGWVGVGKNNFPDKGWIIKDGLLSISQAEGRAGQTGGDIVSTEKYGAFDLSFEFKIAKGANGGIKYFVTLPESNGGGAIGLEYQILDDSLHPDAKGGRDGNRTLASLYDMIKAQKTSRFIKQPGGWNTGRIVVYPNNHVEHYLNGIKVLEYERGSQDYKSAGGIE